MTHLFSHNQNLNRNRTSKKDNKFNYCVIGFPVSHSLSPALHNRFFRKNKICAHYSAVEVAPADLSLFMRDFASKYSGANVTIPHKEKIISYLDELSPEVTEIGACNTIVNRGGKLIGYNTDFFGFMDALKSGDVKNLKGKNAIVLGAGGAARAVVYALKKMGAQITILNRTLEHAQKLAKNFGQNFGGLEDFNNLKCDILVNTTSVGMWHKENKKYMSESPISLLSLRGARQFGQELPVVMDIIYRPRMTKFLRDAKKTGCKIITGDKMFVAQARKARELFLVS